MRENETTELKKTLGQLKDGIISITAILNKHGEGELWFGIRDDGVPVGINVGEKTIRDISQAIAAHIEPKIFPELTTIARENTQCIRVRFSGSDKPYFAYGRAYMRVGDEDRQLSAKELENIFLDKSHDALRWDNKASNVQITDLVMSKVKAFVKRANLTWDTLPNALHKLSLLQNGKPVNAALVFFAKKPIVKLRCAVFASTTTSTILDRQDYEGGILELIEHGQAYILKNIHTGMRLEGLYRVDVPELAVPAIREALINAFCHRDYHDPHEVQIAIFKDRVELRNPGTLFGGLTLNQLREGNVSARRNPLIADMLRRIQMIEGWGRGMPLILDNEPKTQFQEVAQLFIATFPRPSFEPDYAAKAAAANGVGQSAVDDARKTTEKTTGKQRTVLSEQERNIVQLIKRNPTVSQREIAVKIGLSEDGVRYHTDKLKKKEILRRVGGAKGGHWEIIQNE
jgi:ATP-dependent DNA helicase RecG